MTTTVPEQSRTSAASVAPMLRDEWLLFSIAAGGTMGTFWIAYSHWDILTGPAGIPNWVFFPWLLSSAVTSLMAFTMGIDPSDQFLGPKLKPLWSSSPVPNAASEIRSARRFVHLIFALMSWMIALTLLIAAQVPSNGGDAAFIAFLGLMPVFGVTFVLAVRYRSRLQKRG